MGILDMLKAPAKDSRGRLRLIIAVGLAAMLLILCSDLLPSCRGEARAKSPESSTEQYAEQMEQRLTQLISGIAGAGRTEVMVTLRNGKEYIYASEDRVSLDSSESVNGGVQASDRREDSENSYIIIDGAEGEQALLRTELMPTVSGVVVLCEGAEDPQVYERVKEAVTTALNISSKRVCIIKISQ